MACAASGPGVTTLQSVDLDGNVREEAGGRRRIYDFDVAHGVIAFCASDASSPGELYMLTQGAEARLTDLNPWLHDRDVAEPEQHYFTAPDGWRIEGWILKPRDFTPDKVYPTVMEIHGGPHAQYGWTFFHELQILAGMGFAVLYLNPRGSDGYGERFRREAKDVWRGLSGENDGEVLRVLRADDGTPAQLDIATFVFSRFPQSQSQ